MSITPHIADEIFGDILSYLPCQDLARVCVASRRLRCISQPLLYTGPELNDRSTHPPSLQAFVRTLLTPGCESLATNVSRLTISWCHSILEPEDDDYIRFTAAASRFGLSDLPLSADIKVMILLNLLPRLRFLHLLPLDGTSWFRLLANMHRAEEPTADTVAGLQSLREYRCDYTTCARPSALLVLLPLPNIRTIAMPIAAHRKTQVDECGVAEYGTSAVTRLEFLNARLPHPVLKHILLIPRALTHFSYCTTLASGRNFGLVKFGLSLAPLKESLQTLILDFPCMGTPEPPWIDDDLPMLSLREWPALRNLSSSLLPLLARGPERFSLWRLAHVLPAGLRTLTILRDESWLATNAAHELVALLEQKEAVVPRLESVGLSEHVEMWQQVEERLKEMCVRTGVQMAGTSVVC